VSSNRLRSRDLHRAELIKVLRDAHAAAEGPKQKRFPSRYSPFLWSELTGRPVNPWCAFNGGVNLAIRRLHDFYGWMAKDGPGGRCAGALYRTLDYLGLDPKQRDGSKGPGRNVHIEHAVPVGVLEKILWHRKADFDRPAELHRFLVHHSVCVAFTHNEERAMRGQVAPATTDAFDSEGNPVHNYPFRRYLPLEHRARASGTQFRIINVLSGARVDLEHFSFADHVRALKQVSSMALPSRSFLYGLEIFPVEHWIAG